ncbi:MAG: hypothetical protein LBE34_12730 [Flavobacteriaceae bacterium]|jgi:hypothetical protein|nr:hypothetical protein [Flavobacteriaceae bacterium]
MIQTENNFLPQKVFEELQNYCQKSEFERINLGEKEFEFLKVPDDVLSYLQEEKHDLIVTFIRRATPDFDTDLRIHSDNIIQGEKTSLAKVLYLNQKGTVSENGTAFWNHHIYGEELPKDVTDEEFNRLITEDANDWKKWSIQKVFYSEPNKLLTYSSNLFHSKYPARIVSGERIVLVVFYKDK